jgi:type IV pilus assembly protein PilE
MNRPQRGFTLIEVMIVVAVLAVLVIIALPAYLDSTRKARRADGKTALIGLQLAQEKFRANCRFYAGAVANANVCGSDAASSTVSYPGTSKEGYYTVAVSAANGNSFTITADPRDAQSGDGDCDPMQIQFPEQTKTPADCWN